MDASVRFFEYDCGRYKRAPSVIPVIANIDFTMNASIGKLVYTNFNIYNLKGSLIVRDESVRMSGVNMQLMDGTMAMNGSYSTKNPKAPDIDFSMDIKNFDMQKTVATFNTVEKLAPMAKYCSGKFGTNMTVKGQLDQHMSPGGEFPHRCRKAEHQSGCDFEFPCIQ